jgi:hypothetical protein
MLTHGDYNANRASDVLLTHGWTSDRSKVYISPEMLAFQSKTISTLTRFEIAATLHSATAVKCDVDVGDARMLRVRLC